MDALINSFFSNYSNTFLDSFMKLFSFIGSVYILLPLSLIVFIYLIYRKKNAFIFSAVMIGGFVSFNVLKALFQRLRPEGHTELGYSFPSGHATMSIIFFSLMIYFFRNNIKNKILRVSFVIINILMIILIGFSRIYLQEHWMSDVIAGYSLGAIWLLIIFFIFKI